MIQAVLNYTIDRKIGEGGMGTVYLGSNPAMGQKVAIKMLHPHYANNPLVREKFRHEAMMLSGLTHPNIVKFINFIENEEGVFLIMEYVDGVTLEDYIHKQTGLIVEDRAKPMIRELLDAFRHAHSQGIIHCDIKPSNILVDKDNHIKILDFGIARILTESHRGDEMIKGGGSAEYMSPEQVLGKPLDARSDIYSLGVVIYEMLTGRYPYDKSLSAMDIKHRVVSEPLPRLRDAYEYVSDNAQSLVDKATRKNPDERFATCGEMLQTFSGGSGGGGAEGRSTGSSGSETAGSNNKEKANKTWIIWVVIGLLVGALAVGGLIWWNSHSSSSPALEDEEEVLSGNSDALLIDNDGQSDDDDVLFGANPVDSLSAGKDKDSKKSVSTQKGKSKADKSKSGKPKADKKSKSAAKEDPQKQAKPNTLSNEDTYPQSKDRSYGEKKQVTGGN